LGSIYGPLVLRHLPGRGGGDEKGWGFLRIQRDRSGRPSFFIELGEVQATFGTHIAVLAYQYGLDVEPELASILPSSDEA
jgi:hypothetical protein